MWTLSMTLMLLCVAAVCLCADTDGSKYVDCQLEMWTLNMTLMLLCVAAVCLCADTDGSKYVDCQITLLTARDVDPEHDPDVYYVQRLCASARTLTAPSMSTVRSNPSLEMWTLNMTLMLLCVAAVCLCADTDGSKYVGCQVKSIGTTIINS
ncbi:hypothetical protein J6590_034377 [Homalodisca vitripennis]|nr:hypothetical protein J6590_034377 [Homalodisca vitripennis]